MSKRFLTVGAVACWFATSAFAQTRTGPAVWSGLFGNRDLQVETPNNPGNDYTMVLHENDPDYYLDLFINTYMTMHIYRLNRHLCSSCHQYSSSNQEQV